MGQTDEVVEHIEALLKEGAVSGEASAVLETLRKAENKIMKAIMPYLLIKQRFSDA